MQSARVHRVAANALPSPLEKRPSLAVVPPKRAASVKPVRPKVLDPRTRKSPKLVQISREIDVFDSGGYLVRTYSVVLGANCLAQEYEEYALIIAERDGLTAAGGLCWACCDRF